MIDKLNWFVLNACMVIVAVAVSAVVVVACYNAVLTMLGLR